MKESSLVLCCVLTLAGCNTPAPTREQVNGNPQKLALDVLEKVISPSGELSRTVRYAYLLDGEKFRFERAGKGEVIVFDGKTYFRNDLAKTADPESLDLRIVFRPILEAVEDMEYLGPAKIFAYDCWHLKWNYPEKQSDIQGWELWIDRRQGFPRKSVVFYVDGEKRETFYSDLKNEPKNWQQLFLPNSLDRLIAF